MFRLTGANGVGKSTLLDVCSGYLPVSSGRVEVAGSDPRTAEGKERRRVVRAHPALFPAMTVRDHLTVAARASRTPVEALARRAEQLGLNDWLDYEVAALSTGTAAKVWWLLCTPGRFEVALIDEPFGALDAPSSAIVASEINEFGARGLVLLVTHTMPAGLTVSGEIRLGMGVVSTTKALEV